MNRFSLVLILATIFCTSNVLIVKCWEDFEPDLFDLVEEVNQNFYDFFEIQEDSGNAEIRKAYRRLSMQWHPDKNPSPDAEKIFRQIVGIYEVLKDSEKRERYDEILEFGLPDWREPIYYYRRVRKLNLQDLVIGFAFIISIGHYFVLWAQYFEKKLALEDHMGDVEKRVAKQQKKKKLNADLEKYDENLKNIYKSLPTPGLKDTYPYRFPVWFFYFIVGLPSLIKQIIEERKTKQNDDLDSSYESEELESPRARKRKMKSREAAQQLQKSLNPTKIEKSDIKTVTYDKEDQEPSNSTSVASSPSNVSNTQAKKAWTDKQKAELIKAIVKYPPGSTDRWIKISEFVGRSQTECLQMEKEMKTNLTSTQNSQLNASTWKELKENESHLGNGSVSKESGWSQEQQSQLEKALKETSKDVSNRWDQIASNVTGKTKDECIQRYKELCATLKKK